MATNRENNNTLAWANALDKITKEQMKARQPQGLGWQTFHEILEIVNVGQCKLRKQIKTGIENGSILVFQGQVMAVDGKLRQKIWYKIK